MMEHVQQCSSMLCLVVLLFQSQCLYLGCKCQQVSPVHQGNTSTTFESDIKQVFIDLRTTTRITTTKKHTHGVHQLDSNILISAVISVLILFPLAGLFIYAIRRCSKKRKREKQYEVESPEQLNHQVNTYEINQYNSSNNTLGINNTDAAEQTTNTLSYENPSFNGSFDPSNEETGNGLALRNCFPNQSTEQDAPYKIPDDTVKDIDNFSTGISSGKADREENKVGDDQECIDSSNLYKLDTSLENVAETDGKKVENTSNPTNKDESL